MRGWAAWLGIFAAAGVARGAEKLGAYHVAPQSVAVAGVSSGGFMAVQLHVAYSETFTAGAAVFAGGPWNCAQGSLSTAMATCMMALPSAPDAAALIRATDAAASAGELDSTTHLAGQRVYLWSGTQDTTVKQAVMNSLATYYEHYVGSGHVTYDKTHAAGHSWVSPDGPNSCGAQQSPYINACGLDPEEAFLSLFYGSLNARSSAPHGALVEFDQNEFFDDHAATSHSVAATGWLYVPPRCASGATCKLLVALHGCLQSYGQIGDAFVKKAGLLEWADANDLLVLFPQTTTSLQNQNACWDWWGYDDPNYAKKSGRQMRAIHRMVERIVGDGASSADAGTDENPVPDAGMGPDAGTDAGADGGSPNAGSGGDSGGDEERSTGCATAGVAGLWSVSLAMLAVRRKNRARRAESHVPPAR